jgi:hypothetical protein
MTTSDMLLFHGQKTWGNLKQYEGFYYRSGDTSKILTKMNWKFFDPVHRPVFPPLGSQFTRILAILDPKHNPQQHVKSIEMLLHFMHPIGQGIIEDKALNYKELILLCNLAHIIGITKIDEHRILFFKRAKEY